MFEICLEPKTTKQHLLENLLTEFQLLLSASVYLCMSPYMYVFSAVVHRM